MKRIICIIIGIIVILFSAELVGLCLNKGLDIEFYFLKIISVISIGNILCLLGIFYPFKSDK